MDVARRRGDPSCSRRLEREGDHHDDEQQAHQCGEGPVVPGTEHARRHDRVAVGRDVHDAHGHGDGRPAAQDAGLALPRRAYGGTWLHGLDGRGVGARPGRHAVADWRRCCSGMDPGHGPAMLGPVLAPGTPSATTWCGFRPGLRPDFLGLGTAFLARFRSTRWSPSSTRAARDAAAEARSVAVLVAGGIGLPADRAQVDGGGPSA